MNIINFNSTGGASGDMILGTLINLGVSTADLQTALEALNIGSFSIEHEKANEHSLAGTRATVKIAPEAKPIRHLAPICDMINDSNLPTDVKTMSIKVFTNLAEAEAKVHGTTTDHIHFHEVGAVDSIIDIIGSCLALSILKIDAVSVDPLPVGTGYVDCEHGRLPVPVPATIELLKGHPIEKTDEPFELVTPTGAALLTTWKEVLPNNAPTKSIIIKNTGVGFGQRKLNNRINMLRAVMMESAIEHNIPEENNDTCIVIESNLDDMTPELIGALCNKLMDNGALDVFTTSIQMKKQRPGCLLTVLSKPSNKKKLITMIFKESTTFGVREYETKRTILKRRHETIETPYGNIRIKIGTLNGKDITRSPEYDDCLACAKKHNVPVRIVHESAIKK